MKRVVLAFVSLSVLFLSARPAHAQEQGKVGLVVGVPTDIGVLWHITENIAVRPEINFSFGSSESELLGMATESSGSSYGLEGSLLYYLAGTDSVRTYVSPRIGFDWASSEDNDSDDDISSDGFEISASYGAQYTPVPRFSIFGEIGLEYARSTQSVQLLGEELESTSSSWGPRTQVGIILYLGGL